MKNISLSFIIILIATGCFFNKSQQGKNSSGMDVLMGNQVPNTVAGDYLEYVMGGSAGAEISKYMDKQTKDLKKEITGGTIERIGEGIYITFNPSSAFAANSTELNDVMKNNIKGLVKGVDDYEETEIIIEGHSDSTGTKEDNLKISAARAKAVSDYALTQGLDKYRMTVIGYGDQQPRSKKQSKKDKKIISDRRVEIVIIATKRLRALAKRGDIN